MSANQDHIQVLFNKIETLLFRQTGINAEIDELKKEVELMKKESTESFS